MSANDEIVSLREQYLGYWGALDDRERAGETNLARDRLRVATLLLRMQAREGLRVPPPTLEWLALFTEIMSQAVERVESDDPPVAKSPEEAMAWLREETMLATTQADREAGKRQMLAAFIRFMMFLDSSGLWHEPLNAIGRDLAARVSKARGSMGDWMMKAHLAGALDLLMLAGVKEETAAKELAMVVDRHKLRLGQAKKIDKRTWQRLRDLRTTFQRGAVTDAGVLGVFRTHEEDNKRMLAEDFQGMSPDQIMTRVVADLDVYLSSGQAIPDGLRAK